MMICKSNGMKIAAMEFPYRKKKGLGIYDKHTNTWYKVATFNSDETADDYIEYLARFLGAERVEEYETERSDKQG